MIMRGCWVDKVHAHFFTTKILTFKKMYLMELVEGWVEEREYFLLPLALHPIIRLRRGFGPAGMTRDGPQFRSAGDGLK
jgi:hypothetical protein